MRSIPCSAKVLVVGAGGIGCEVLKNLVLSGVRNISIVDLDMVDVSNLNRQFLFSKEDVGAYKADVAAKAIKRYLRNEDALTVSSHKTRIQDLPLDVITSHDVIISALDNLEARKYLNGVCVTSAIPLMEAGSTGYNGQGYPLLSFAGGECFECRGLPKVTVYPVCTVRLTAEKPEHCIAWSRYLFESIFTIPVASEDDDNSLTDLGFKIRDLRKEHANDSQRFAQATALWLFHDQIEEYRIAKLVDPAVDGAKLPQSHAWMKDHFVNSPPSNAVEIDKSASANARSVQTPEYYVNQFVNSLILCDELFGGESSVKFDKDVEEIMSFVAAASSLRMLNFKIPLLSAWEIKSIAGSIQPAVASTNAIVAGVEVVNALRLLKAGKSTSLEDYKKAGLRFVWTRAVPSNNRLMLAENLDQSNTSCLVCSTTSCHLQLQDFSAWPIGRFVKEIVEREMDGRDVSVMDSKCVLYDPDLIEECPEMGDKVFTDGPLVQITVSALNLGALDMVIEENRDLDSEYRFIKRHVPDQTLKADAWKQQPASCDIEDIPDDNTRKNDSENESSFMKRTREDSSSPDIVESSKKSRLT